VLLCDEVTMRFFDMDPQRHLGEQKMCIQVTERTLEKLTRARPRMSRGPGALSNMPVNFPVGSR